MHKNKIIRILFMHKNKIMDNCIMAQEREYYSEHF